MGPSLYGWYVVAGLTLGMLGDLLLALRFLSEKLHRLFFAAGSVSFFLGHIVYILAILALCPAAWLYAIPIAVVALGAACFYAYAKEVRAGKITPLGVLYIGGVLFMTACAATITNIIDTVGISADTRLSAASGSNKAQTGHAAIGANMDAASLIHLHAGDTLRIKGVSLPAANDGTSVAVRYSATATFMSASYMHNGYTWGELNFTSSGDIVTVTSRAEQYIRLSPICTDASAVVATINEEIS